MHATKDEVSKACNQALSVNKYAIKYEVSKSMQSSKRCPRHPTKSKVFWHATKYKVFKHATKHEVFRHATKHEVSKHVTKHEVSKYVTKHEVSKACNQT